MKTEKFEEILKIPEKTEVTYDGGFFIVKGLKGELKKKIVNPMIGIIIKKDEVVFVSKKATKREKKVIRSFKAHLKNMLSGVNEEYVYNLKVCSGHFPMNVSVKGDDFIIKNFFGGSIPRTLKIKQGVNIAIEGDIITVKGLDKELVGQTSADIENLTKRAGYDKRIFQDGIYITSKAGKKIK